MNAANKESPAKTGTKKARILVIDDEPDYRELLKFELGSQGYDIITAGMASEGLAKLNSERVDLLITDVRMPGEMDGIDMVQFFRKKKPYLKVIFITGYAIEEKLQAVLKQKMTVVLRKPFNLDDLTKEVRKFLES